MRGRKKKYDEDEFVNFPLLVFENVILGPIKIEWSRRVNVKQTSKINRIFYTANWTLCPCSPFSFLFALKYKIYLNIII